MSLHISTGRKQHIVSSGPIIIGVCGLCRNTGVTCFSIALSNYLCSKKRRETAYVEINPSSEVQYINHSQSHTEPFGAFSHLNVIFYPEADFGNLPEILSQGHEFYILDFGIWHEKMQREFLRCHVRLVICDLSPWKRGIFQSQLQNLNQKIKLQETFITFLINSGKYTLSDKQLRHYPLLLQKREKLVMIPYLSNPFQLIPGEFEVFEKILAGI